MKYLRVNQRVNETGEVQVHTCLLRDITAIECNYIPDPDLKDEGKETAEAAEVNSNISQNNESSNNIGLEIIFKSGLCCQIDGKRLLNIVIFDTDKDPKEDFDLKTNSVEVLSGKYSLLQAEELKDAGTHL